MGKIKWKRDTLKEDLKAIALQYKTKTELREARNDVYKIAQKTGLWDYITEHMPKNNLIGSTPPNKKWYPETVKEEALKHSRKVDFINAAPTAYTLAIKWGILNEVCAHMPDKVDQSGENSPHFMWSNEAIRKEAQSFKTKTEFARQSGGAYDAAKKLGIFEEVTAHMGMNYEKGEERYNFKWSDEELARVASMCKTRGEFIEQYGSAYIIALTKGLLDKICAHMPLAINTSRPEKEILEYVKIYFEKAKKFYARKIKIEGKPYIKGFEIDILVPELNKGIEFDGKYYHSFDGLKLGRSHWPDEDIHNYHQIKDDYFKSKGIEILHISEKEWLANKEECFQRINQFLGI